MEICDASFSWFHHFFMSFSWQWFHHFFTSFSWIINKTVALPTSSQMSSVVVKSVSQIKLMFYIWYHIPQFPNICSTKKSKNVLSLIFFTFSRNGEWRWGGRPWQGNSWEEGEANIDVFKLPNIDVLKHWNVRWCLETSKHWCFKSLRIVTLFLSVTIETTGCLLAMICYQHFSELYHDIYLWKCPPCTYIYDFTLCISSAQICV